MGDIIVVASGESSNQSIPSGLSSDPWVIAADGGAMLARALGLEIDAVVGDMDSIDEQLRSALVESGAEFHEYPQDKEFTDFEAALALAAERQARAHDEPQIVIIGGHGGRLDHLAGNLAAIDAFAHKKPVHAWIGHDLVIPLTGTLTIGVRMGATVSIIARAPSVVSTEGLRWQLHAETLEPNSARGISNEVVEEKVTVSVAEGLCHVVVPQAKEVIQWL